MILLPIWLDGRRRDGRMKEGQQVFHGWLVNVE
jgi:hypothetical protein